MSQSIDFFQQLLAPKLRPPVPSMGLLKIRQNPSVQALFGELSSSWSSRVVGGIRFQRLCHHSVGYRQAPSGTAVIASGEGNRVLLLEVQALASGTNFAAPRRVSNGWDNNRLLQIAAVLEKKVGITLSKSDLYVNVVGGIDIDDPAGDLGVAVAIATDEGTFSMT